MPGLSRRGNSNALVVDAARDTGGASAAVGVLAWLAALLAELLAEPLAIPLASTAQGVGASPRFTVALISSITLPTAPP